MSEVSSDIKDSVEQSIKDLCHKLSNEQVAQSSFMAIDWQSTDLVTIKFSGKPSNTLISALRQTEFIHKPFFLHERRGVGKNHDEFLFCATVQPSKGRYQFVRSSLGRFHDGPFSTLTLTKILILVCLALFLLWYAFFCL
jgi:hypothetical protein